MSKTTPASPKMPEGAATIEQVPSPTLRVALDGNTGKRVLIVSFPWDEQGTPSKNLRETGKGIMMHCKTGWQSVLLPNGEHINVNLMAGVKQVPQG